MYHNNLVAIVIFLVAIGLVVVFSSSILQGGTFGGSVTFFRQLLWMSLAFFGMWIMSKVDYHKVVALGPYVLGISVILLIAVLIPGIGYQRYGAQRWIRSGPLGFQPSEVAKLAAVVFATYWVCRNRERIQSIKYVFFPLVALAGLLGGLMMLEPDFGTAVLLVTVVMGIGVLAGMRLWPMLPAMGAALPMLYFLVWHVPYRRDRLLAFMNPWEHLDRSGYHLVQSLIALGSGGITGLGLGESRQKLGFLPMASNDFVFSILGEELGLLGALLVVGLFAAFVWNGMRAAKRARDLEGFLLIQGVTLVIGIQALINLCVVTGLMPTKGISLPFISSGGSSLVIFMCAVGLMLNAVKQGEEQEELSGTLPVLSQADMGEGVGG